MKILVISLLRLGDVLLQVPLLRGLKERYPGCEIHLMVNRQFAQVEGAVQDVVDKILFFERELLQNSCAKKECNIFWGYERLRSDVQEIKQTEYDLLYNFTHNRLSAFLAGLIPAKERKGIYAIRGNFFGLSNPWIQFFNRYFGAPEAMGFHYTELLAKSLEIPLPYFSLQRRLPSVKTKILIQPLTSDSKKNWNLKNFSMLAKILPDISGCEVVVLGAPFEKQILQGHFEESQLKICPLVDVIDLLKETRLLITGDTSIKHLAALFDVPTLELALGSSRPLQVGAYSNNSVILQSRVECGPCPHSEPCSRSYHLCGQNLRLDAVTTAANLMLQGERDSWTSFAQAHHELNIFMTSIRPVFGWSIESISPASKEYFDHVNQRKMMVVGDLDRRHQEMLKEDRNAQRTGKLPDGGAQATGKGVPGGHKDSGI